MGKQRRSGNEHFHADGTALSNTLLEFWQWVDSDLVSNAIRGRLAEYLIAKDLGIADGIRSEWIAYDLTSKNGTKVEVKSAAYVQTWEQRRPSLISFDIRPTLGWDPDTAKFGVARRRQADVYVFALLSEKDESKLDPMNVSHWRFFVLPTRVLDSSYPDQKSIGLQKLLTLQPDEVKFGAIAAAVEKARGAISIGLSASQERIHLCADVFCAHRQTLHRLHLLPARGSTIDSYRTSINSKRWMQSVLPRDGQNSQKKPVLTLWACKTPARFCINHYFRV